MATKTNKPTKRNPSIRAKKAFDKMVENGGVISKAMIDAGYSPNTAKTPQKLTESEGWKNLMEDYLSDEKLKQAHEELLNQAKFEYFTFPKNMSDEEITAKVTAVGVELVVIQPGEKGKYAFYKTIDASARKSALDMAYKLRGDYAPDKSINLNLTKEVDTEAIQELTHKLNEVHRGTSISSNGGATRTVGTETQDKE